MTALEFLQDNLEDITFLCQLNNNEKDFKDIQLCIKHLLNDHKEFTRLSQIRKASAIGELRYVMDNLDEMIVDYIFMDVLYDIAYPPYSNWLQDLFSFAKLDNPQMDDTLKTMDQLNQQMYNKLGYLPPACRTPEIEAGLTQVALLIHILKDRGFTKFDYDEKTIDLIKQELDSLAKKGYIEFEIKDINFSDQTDRLPIEKIYLEITKCKNPYHNVPNGLHKTPQKKKSTSAKQATSPISISKGQDRIRDLLYFNNIPFKQEHTEVINGRVHRFDFLVYKDNGVIYFIEYDGEQHFKPVKQWGGEAGFKERQARDEEKNQWCKKNGYELIRIPYTVQNKITIKDLRPETSPFVS